MELIAGVSGQFRSALTMGTAGGDGLFVLGGFGTVTNTGGASFIGTGFDLAGTAAGNARMVVSNGATLLVNHTGIGWGSASGRGEIEVGSNGLVQFAQSAGYTMGTNATLTFRDGGRYAMQSSGNLLTANAGATIRGDGVITGNVNVVSGGTTTVGWATGGRELRITGNFTNQSGSVLNSGFTNAGIGSNAVLHVSSNLHLGQTVRIYADTNGASYGGFLQSSQATNQFSGLSLGGTDLTFAAGSTAIWHIIMPDRAGLWMILSSGVCVSHRDLDQCSAITGE